jgi:hypothetical protein
MDARYGCVLMRLSLWRWLVLGWFGITLVSACSFAIDLDELENGACPTGQKLCNKKCISVNDPGNGCGNKSCTPCNLAYANAKCSTSDGSCQIASCTGNSADCDGMAANGCERDLAHDPNFCGSCKASPCVAPNGVPECSASHCSIRSCTAGFADCNKVVADGCEAPAETCSQ